ncbi:transglycosylase domain-containing protein [Streptomyces camelliae]|uniref:Transglycosylase domain-containing protein n=1 Tax=Streptomyces camelliae TaxID=3004093 RepID=A0ABY7PGG8_9ACTN|nr:transglycosylase domain-containing protein [Streptomyces sp. HUAS 2-6]WBO68605.1 transglycosylase domain-containing protein [Streptomyces sp. HUAS 2-6]
MSEHRRRPSGRTGPAGSDGMPQGGRAAARRAAKAGAGRGRRAADTRGAEARRTGRRRLIDYPRAGKRGLRRWLPSWKLVSGTFLLFFGGLVGLFGYAYATTTIPSANPSTQLQSNTYYWSDGSVMATQGSTNRQNVDLAEVPKLVQWDFLAAENATFYSDPGVDTQGMLRAVYHMATGGEVQSGSTITQQFVKNTYLTQSQSVTRKLREIMISLKIGDQMSKQQILQGYLNSCYYGRDAYGIEAAARTYYHEHASQLTVSQGAFIAATVNEPSLLMHADTDPQAKAQAEARWKYVLDRMAKINKITGAQEQQYLAAGFPTPKPYAPSAGMSGQTGYLVQTAEKYVEAHSSLTDQQLGHGGYQIYTTFDKKKVNALSASVAAMEKKHLDAGHRSADKDVQVGAASIDPSTGAVVALYGGAGWDKGHWTDNADATGVPVGSTFKPIDLAAALDHGAVLSPGQPASPVTPDSKFNGDDGITIKNQQGQEMPDSNDPTGLLHQRNDVPTKWGYITLRKAMEQSVNTPYVQLGEYVGYNNVEGEALKAGLLRKSLQYDTPGFYIGTSTPSAIRMADVYATFDDGGVQHEPYSVSKVVAGGQQLPGFEAPKGTTAMPSSTADTVTDVLQGVVKSGTGTNAQALGRPVAGKTGTTDDYKSAWFIGYTPQLVTSVSMFKEDPKNSGLQSMKGVGGFSKVFGADMPTEVWTGYMTAALQGQPVQQFPPAPQLGQGTDEYGAPSPTPSAPPSTAPASPTTSPSPSPSAGACHQKRHCPSPTPTDTSGTTTGGTTTGTTTGGATDGGLIGGGTGGTGGTTGTTTGGTSPTPTSSRPGRHG